MVTRRSGSAKAEATCAVCGRGAHAVRLVPVATVRPEIAAIVEASHPDWRATGSICRDDLNAARRAHIEGLLIRDRGELSQLDAAVVTAITQHEVLSGDIEAELDQTATTGEWLSDKVAAFGGSWAFILSFLGIMAVWIMFNALVLAQMERFDPYPFVLLNLVLSCVAAMQAPFIMMSQRRQEVKDRIRSQNDYRINLKAELEIRLLHEKVDHLMLRQGEHLAELEVLLLDQMQDMRGLSGR